MAKPDKDRAERERARVYQARLELRASQLTRRRRDTIVASVVGGIVILAAIGGQFAYYGAGPGAPVTEISPSPTPSVSSDPVPGPTTTP
ncbi:MULTISPECIES: dioxygenase [Microbacterium]|uniref:dioxygenase n=1 Tax=Microbacterium TaxID=33882 RepID=UPI000C2BB93F|nr:MULTISPECIES: dioxygenase [Microbacterium]MDO8382710.1 dioxygenase [Microbacterium sp.]